MNPFKKPIQLLRKRSGKQKRGRSRRIEPFWIEEKDGEFVAVLEHSKEVVVRGASRSEVMRKMACGNIGEQPSEVIYAMRGEPLPDGVGFIPTFWREKKSPHPNRKTGSEGS